jgi:hypothetical protein
VAVESFMALTNIFNKRPEVLTALLIKTQFFQDIARESDDENSTLFGTGDYKLQANTAKHSKIFKT